MTEPQLLLAWERLTAELMQDTRRFSASFRHNLAHYVNQVLLDGLCLVAQVGYLVPSEKTRSLHTLDGKTAQLRVLVRQCYTQQALGAKRYEYHQNSINELGKMIGGWLKYQQEEQP